MEHLHFLILDLALILTVASIVTILFKKIKQPVVLGYIVAGFLISPNFEWLPTVIDSENITVWADIGIVFLMFAIGLEFNFHKIAEVGRGAIIIAATVITAMITIGYSLGQLLGMEPMDAIFLGCMLSMSSTMIVLKSFEELRLKKHKFTNLVIGALVIEDIAGIFMMIVLTTISVSKSFSGGELAKEISVLLLVLVIILCIGIYIVPTVVKKITRYLTDEVLLIFSLALCFLMVVICVGIGFSEALGAFVSGSILAGTRQAERIEHLIKPIKDLFGAVFFVSVGMLIEPAVIASYWWQIIIIAIVVVLGQMTFSAAGCLISGQSLETSVKVGFSMLQVGEFSFILAALGSSLGVMSSYLYPVIVSVSVITSFTTPMFMKNSDKAYKALVVRLPGKIMDFITKYTSPGKSAAMLDKDWKAYLSTKLKKLIIGLAGLSGTFILVTSIIEPYLFKTFELHHRLIGLVLVIIAFICMFPFIHVMCSIKETLYLKLWHKSNFNKLPLLAIRAISVFITLMFAISILRRYFLQMPMIVHALAAFLIVLYIIRSDFIRGRYLDLETRFFVNFNERIIEREKLERSEKSDKVWVDEKMYIIEYEILDNKGREYIKDMISNKAFGCMILSVFRSAEELINLPRANTALKNGDILTVVGSLNGIESYTEMLTKDNKINEPKNGPVTLKEYLYFQMFDDDILPENQLMCCALKPVKKGDIFCRKPIKDNNFIARYGGYILAVEREGLPLLSPGRNLILIEDDVIWCIGTQDMVNKLEEDGILAL